MINPEEKYFLSFTSSEKDNPSSLGLKFNADKNCYLDSRSLQWKKGFIWENGWSEENGYFRLPELEFNDLWTLLTESNLEENILGSAEFLDRKYPFELKKRLTDLFSKKSKLSRKLTLRLSNLEVLKNGMNRTEVIGKSIEEVELDFQQWQNLVKTFDRIKTSRFWDNLLKL